MLNPLKRQRRVRAHGVGAERAPRGVGGGGRGPGDGGAAALPTGSPRELVLVFPRTQFLRSSGTYCSPGSAWVCSHALGAESCWVAGTVLAGWFVWSAGASSTWKHMGDPTPKHGAIVWTGYGAAAWAPKERIKPRQWGGEEPAQPASERLPAFAHIPFSLSPSSASLAKFHHRSVLRTPLLLPTPSSLASPKNEINKSLLEGAPLRKLTFDLPGFALFPSGHAARLPLLPCSRYRSGAGRGRGWREGDRSTDGIHREAGGRLEMQSQMTEKQGEGKECVRVWRRKRGRETEIGVGETESENEGREKQKERREGAGEGAREGGREEEGREGGREGGESLAPRSLSPSPARSLPLPRRLRCPRRALRSDWQAAGGAGEGGGEGGAFRDGGAERGGRLSVRLDGQWLLPATSPHANCLLPLGHGLSRREASIVPALPGLLVAGRGATFPKEARRADGRRNSVTAGRRHESPRPAQGPRGVPARRCPRVQPAASAPALPGRQQPQAPPAALAPGREVPPGSRAGLRARAGQASRRPLRTEGPAAPHRCRSGGRGAAGTDGRTDGRASCQCPSPAVLWPLALSCGSLSSPGCAAIAVCPPPSARVLARRWARETNRPTDSLDFVSFAFLSSDNSQYFSWTVEANIWRSCYWHQISIWTKLKLLGLTFIVCVFGQNFSWTFLNNLI